MIDSNVQVQVITGGKTISASNPLPTSITGSLAKLSTDPFPSGNEGDTLLSYDIATKATTIYKYISGDWREL